MNSQIANLNNGDSELPDAVVMKFGGSCLKNAAAFDQIVKITKLYNEQRKIYVASALFGITNILLEVTEAASHNDNDKVKQLIDTIRDRHLSTINEIFPKESGYQDRALNGINNFLNQLTDVIEEVNEFGIVPYFVDYIIAFGEKMSTFILQLFLEMKGFDAHFFTGEDLIITDDHFNNAFPEMRHTVARVDEKIVPLLEDLDKNPVICITGFIGRNKIGYTTTLGRGGSDFTATIIARAVYECRAVNSIKVILWKDVDGILSANPAYVDKPALIRNLNFAEAKELAFFGAKVLHPKCLAVIEHQNINVELINFDNPEDKVDFSTISSHSDKDDIKGVGTIKVASMITTSTAVMVRFPGFAGKVFSTLGDKGININYIAQSSSEVAITFIVDREDGEKAIDALKSNEKLPRKWMKIIHEEIGIIAVVGEQVHTSKNKFRIFKALDEIDLEAISVVQSSNGLNISIVVPVNRVQDAANAINNEFHPRP